ncbi:MAG: hypothetical protein NTY25_01170 [Planctomycetia bacterium]|nr:hypothetical protein [Planctomycetia bacterium]
MRRHMLHLCSTLTLGIACWPSACGAVERIRMTGPSPGHSLFIRHDFSMEILDVVLLSDGEDTIVFGVRYGVTLKSAPNQTFASKVTARNLDGTWKVDGEKVRSCLQESQSLSANPADQALDGGAVRPGWGPFNPPAHLIDPALESLRGHVGIQPGRGCANGRCGDR